MRLPCGPCTVGNTEYQARLSGGEPEGYIRTTESYANYKLHLEWRWPAEATNSGVLLHRTGIDRTWPMCVEPQLMHENAGDFWLLSHSTIEVGGQQIGPTQYANGKKKHASNEKTARRVEQL